ncbi:hypothetical protein MKQ68_10850 [Chitinophaga horti]|uniref:Uncharacterized protein n=1 Tax=Chitinophaga horti TaxID=2920382 RepID=A0ABY6J7D7_9BACT|nr:hypothetical protein [Chitinophaga horti]UYQ95599.1 hypothetical protein MKQ68_10850 [Chitinophaga horti]
MIKSLMILCLATCAGLKVHARPPGTIRLFSGNDSIPALGTPASQRQQVMAVVVDSLNKRPRAAVENAKNTLSLNRVGAIPALNGLNDTVKKELFSYVARSYSASKAAAFAKGMTVLKDTAVLNDFFTAKLRGFYALSRQNLPGNSLALPAGIKNKFKGAGAEVSYGDTSHAISGWWNRLNISDEISVGSIPFAFDYVNVSGYNNFSSDLNDRHLGKMSFDKRAYLDKLDQHIKEHYDLNKYFLEDIDFRSNMQSFLDQRLDHIRTKSESFLEGREREWLQLVNPGQLMNLDSNQLKNVLLEKSGLSVTDAEAFQKRKQDLIASISNDAYDDSARSQLRNELARFEALESYYKGVLKIKQDIGKGGLDASKLLNSQHDVKSRMQEWMGDKNNTPQLAKELLPLGIMQKVMLRVKNLDLGNIVANASKGSVADLFMTGVSGSALHNNKFAMTTIGQRNDIGVRHTGLTSSISTPTYNLQSARMGIGDIDKQHTHVSLLNANTKSTSRNGFDMAALSQNLFVGSISKMLELGKYGTLEAELSKSNNQFSNMMSGTVEQSAAPKAAIAGLLDNVWTTLSAGVRYAGEVKEWNMTQGAYFNYAGLGHSNPGNPSGTRGSLQYGLNLRRSWQKNKAAVMFRTDVRDIDRSALSGGSKWKNLQLTLDGRYRFSRRLTMNLRLNQASMNESEAGVRTNVFLNRKVTVTSQANGRFGELMQSNVFMAGLQQMEYLAVQSPVKSTLLNLNMMQSLSLGSGIISFNTFLSHDLSGNMAYGNMLTSDAGYNYNLWKVFSCGSAITFLDTNDMARQIGLRQSLGARLLKKWSLNVFLDARKDLIRSSNNFLYGNFKTEMTLHYSLN